MIFNASRFSAQEFLSPSKTAAKLLKFFNKLFLKNLLTFLSVCDIILMRLRKAPNQQGLLVKRLRRRPLTAETGVRFPYGSPKNIRITDSDVFFNFKAYKCVRLSKLFRRSEVRGFVLYPLHQLLLTMISVDSQAHYLLLCVMCVSAVPDRVLTSPLLDHLVGFDIDLYVTRFVRLVCFRVKLTARIRFSVLYIF